MGPIRKKKMIVATLAIAAISMTLVSAAIIYFYTGTLTLSSETPKVTWVTGTDITATVGTNKTWCQIAIGNLEPNATTVYTNALKFTVAGDSNAGGMTLQIVSLTDPNTIIYGIKFYVFTQGVSSTGLTLVDGGTVTISNTDGNAAVSSVGYRQAAAPAGYGSTTLPIASNGFSGVAATTYIVALEVMGEDGILTTQTANLQLNLVWS